MCEHYVNLAVADDNFFNQGFNDFALVWHWQFRPAVIQGIGLVQYVIGGQLVDFQKIHPGFELGQFDRKLVQPRFGGFVEVAKALRRLRRDLLLMVTLVRPLHFIPDFLNLALLCIEQNRFFGQVSFGLLQMLRNPFRLAEKDFQFLSGDISQVHNRYLIAAIPAKVFRIVRFDIRPLSVSVPPATVSEPSV